MKLLQLTSKESQHVPTLRINRSQNGSIWHKISWNHIKSMSALDCIPWNIMNFRMFQDISGYFTTWAWSGHVAAWPTESWDVGKCRELSHSCSLPQLQSQATRPHGAIWAILCHAYDIIWNHAVANQTKIYKDQTTPSWKPINTYNTSENSGHLYVTMFMSFSVFFLSFFLCR